MDESLKVMPESGTDPTSKVLKFHWRLLKEAAPPPKVFTAWGSVNKIYICYCPAPGLEFQGGECELLGQQRCYTAITQPVVSNLDISEWRFNQKDIRRHSGQLPALVNIHSNARLQTWFCLSHPGASRCLRPATVFSRSNLDVSER